MWYGFKEPPIYWNQPAIDDKAADSKTMPVVLRVWISSKPEYRSHWKDITKGEYVYVFCGGLQVTMRRALAPTSKFPGTIDNHADLDSVTTFRTCVTEVDCLIWLETEGFLSLLILHEGGINGTTRNMLRVQPTNPRRALFQPFRGESQSFQGESQSFQGE